MKAGGGKTKGSAFERVCCEQLSLWLSNGERNDLICRTVGSGGQFTTSFQRGKIKGLAGDLRAQEGTEAFKFFEQVVTECKFWRDLEIIRFLDKKGELYEAMLKVQEEARLTSKPFFWLIAKQNNRPTLLFMPARMVFEIAGAGAIKLEHHALFSGMVYLFKLDEFLKEVPSERLLHAIDTNRTTRSTA